jgi:putative ABC transport system ATP-binding protein
MTPQSAAEFLSVESNDESIREETKMQLVEEPKIPIIEEIKVNGNSSNPNKSIEEDEFKDAEDIVKVENGHKTYLLGLEGVAALRGVSVTIKRQEFVCIFGASGDGKTTLLNILGTIDEPTKGHVFIGGKRVKNSTSDKEMAATRLNKLSFVFQTFNLISTLSALENVELPMQLKGRLSRDQIRKRTKELLDKVRLSDRLNHFPKQLSGGEQQRVTIELIIEYGARALANEPEIMLLDEPTGDLDTKNTDIVMRILTDLNKHGMTLIMVSHDLNLKNYTHRVIRVSDGKVLGEKVINKQDREKHIQDLYDRLEHPEHEKLTIREGADYL